MTSLLASASFGAFVTSLFTFLNYFVWLRITGEGSVPEMNICSIFLMKSDLEWCIHLDLFLYFNHFTHLVSITAGGPESPWGHMQPSSTVDFSWFQRHQAQGRERGSHCFLSILPILRKQWESLSLPCSWCLWLIRSVLRALIFSVLKFIEIVIFGVYLPSLLASVWFWHFCDISFQLF